MSSVGRLRSARAICQTHCYRAPFRVPSGQAAHAEQVKITFIGGHAFHTGMHMLDTTIVYSGATTSMLCKYQVLSNRHGVGISALLNMLQNLQYLLDL